MATQAASNPKKLLSPKAAANPRAKIPSQNNCFIILLKK
jgi:hypothetical protein